jgi:hypothetical protein
MGYWKDEVYRMNFHTEEKLKENIQRDILEDFHEEFSSGKFEHTVFKRCGEC